MGNTCRFVDTLAEKADLRVFMPDYFCGKPWPKDKFPPKDLYVNSIQYTTYELKTLFRRYNDTCTHKTLDINYLSYRLAPN